MKHALIGRTSNGTGGGGCNSKITIYPSGMAHTNDRSDRSGVYGIQHHTFEHEYKQDTSRGSESKSHVLVVCPRWSKQSGQEEIQSHILTKHTLYEEGKVRFPGYGTFKKHVLALLTLAWQRFR